MWPHSATQCYFPQVCHAALLRECILPSPSPASVFTAVSGASLVWWLFFSGITHLLTCNYYTCPVFTHFWVLLKHSHTLTTCPCVLPEHRQHSPQLNFPLTPDGNGKGLRILHGGTRAPYSAQIWVPVLMDNRRSTCCKWTMDWFAYPKALPDRNPGFIKFIFIFTPCTSLGVLQS